MKLNIKRTINAKISSDQIIDYLLKDRGISDKKIFFNPPHPTDIHFEDFFEDTSSFKKNRTNVLTLLNDIKKSGNAIVVYTDYDADGITGGAILWETLYLLGFNAMPYVPNRKTEGYGFSKKGIDAVKKQFNPALIISVDHGIVAHEQIAYAKSLGVPIIITDHHQKLDRKHDDAMAVFHTDKLSGSGVAYFFAKELYENFNPPAGGSNFKLLENNFSSDYLALASIGTISDLVSLVGPARSITKHGLAAFKKINRAGVNELLKEAGIADRDITPYEVGFIIAPRINAFGRLGHALDALRLLCTKQEKRAYELAQMAGETNRMRQELVEKALKEAEQMVDTNKKLIIIYSQNWEEGIIGLIASRIAEKFYRPTIAMTKSDGFAKASARSVGTFDITAFLRSLKDYLVDVGGHKAAAGFTIETKYISKFIKKSEEKAKSMLSDSDLVRHINVDAQIPLSVATTKLAQNLEKLAPFGIGNPKPLFYSQGKLIEARLLGKKNDHLKIHIKDKDSFPLEVIFFNEGKKFADLSRGQKMSIVYNLAIDRWNEGEKLKGFGKLIL